MTLPSDIFSGHNTVRTGGDTASWLQLPIVGGTAEAAPT